MFSKISSISFITFFVVLFFSAAQLQCREEKKAVIPIPHIVALTFDDGPSAQYTPQILDVLKENNIKATFFVIGHNVVAHSDLVKREALEGHAIGNHTWSHPLMAPLESHQQLQEEVTKTENAIIEACGVHTNLFRPPHGWRSPWMVKELEGMGFDIVNWTVDPKDWKHPAATVIVKKVEHAVRSSAIVLMHDGLELKDDPGQGNTVTALKEIIADFKKKNYQFVTITELLADPEFSTEYRSLFRVISEPGITYK